VTDLLSPMMSMMPATLTGGGTGPQSGTGHSVPLLGGWSAQSSTRWSTRLMNGWGTRPLSAPRHSDVHWRGTWRLAMLEMGPGPLNGPDTLSFSSRIGKSDLPIRFFPLQTLGFAPGPPLPRRPVDSTSGQRVQTTLDYCFR